MHFYKLTGISADIFVNLSSIQVKKFILLCDNVIVKPDFRIAMHTDPLLSS